MPKNATIRVTAYPRLHFGLHDCGNATNRVFGGVGVAFKGFPTVVEVSSSSQSTISFTSEDRLSNRTVRAVNNLAERLEPFGAHNINIISSAPEHMGFGSKTSLLLTIAHAIAINNNRQKRYNKESLSLLTQRGGTSGIGVNTFWNGGMVADGGHSTQKENRLFAPSSSRKPITIAPIVSHVKMPIDWRVRLFYDPHFTPIEGNDEKEYFAKLMPLPEIENLRALAATYHGIIPSVLESDLAQLAQAIRDMNNTGMKRHELALQTENTKKFLTNAWKNNYVAGLSSFGPTVFVIDHNGSLSLDAASKAARDLGLMELGTFEFDNHGVSVGHE